MDSSMSSRRKSKSSSPISPLESKCDRLRGWDSTRATVLSQGPEDDVPERRADPEIVIGLDEVVTKMPLPQVQTDLPTQVEMMNRIVSRVVSKVARHEACEERRHKVRPEDQGEEPKEHGR